MTLKLPVLSATQIEKYQTCPRAAGLEYVEKVPKPQAASAAVGTRVHAILEDYSTKGISPNPLEAMDLMVKGKVKRYFPGQIAEAALPLIPPPFVASSEGAFEFASPSGIQWRGAKDLAFRVHEGRYYPTSFPLGDLIVGDFKTTSNFQYAKLTYHDPIAAKGEDYPGDLETDIQANLYAYEALTTFGLQKVSLNWIYLLTTGRPNSHSVRRESQLDHVLAQIDRIESVAKQWLAIRDAKVPAKELPPNLKACGKYGGCPYQGTACVVTSAERWRKVMGVADIQALLAKKKAEQQAIAAGTVPPATGSAPTPPPTFVNASPADALRPNDRHGQVADRPAYWMPGDEMNDTQQLFQSMGKNLMIISQAADNPPPMDVAMSYLAPVESGVVNPPEAPIAAPASPAAAASLQMVHEQDEANARAQDAAEKAAEIQDQYTNLTKDQLKALGVERGLWQANNRQHDKTMRQALREYDRNPPKFEKAPSVPPAPRPTSVPPPPRLHSVPPLPAHMSQHNEGVGQWKAPPSVPPAPPLPNLDSLSVPSSFGRHATPAPAMPPAVPPRLAGLVSTQPIDVLYINCAPFGEVFTQFSQVHGAIAGALQENSGGVQDYRLVEHGKGRGLLANHVHAFLTEQGPGAFGALVVDANTDEGRTCLATLERNAARIVRGF